MLVSSEFFIPFQAMRELHMSDTLISCTLANVFVRNSPLSSKTTGQKLALHRIGDSTSDQLFPFVTDIMLYVRSQKSV